MEIDIYARFERMTGAQFKAGFYANAGAVGHLREAYHGEPYATRHLMPEAFEQPAGAYILAKRLRERLPETLRIAEERERSVYGATTMEQIEPVLKSFIAFVELCEREEAKSGLATKIVASW